MDSAQQLQELFVQAGSKKKEESELAKKTLASQPIDQISQDVVDAIIANLSFKQKPDTIASACEFLQRCVETADIQHYYYALIPAVSPLCLDIKKTVQQSSRKCLEAMFGTVSNNDLVELIPDLIKSMYDPKLVELTIDKVASTKFVTTVTCGTVSILCPLLLRGYAGRKDKTSRACSKIIVNMLQLVENYSDVENFLPVLVPPVKQAIDFVSDPEARNTITTCLEKLERMEDLKEQASSTQLSSKPEGAVELCNCDFTLAYGNKILMKNTNMTLYKGYKYGLIGEGGKSTLLAAISENKVDNFPDASEVKCVFVQTDIIGEKSHLNCVEYVLDDEKIKEVGFTEEQVVKSLLEFGFGNSSVNKNSPAQVDHGVSTLSGGWRMKLALARAMLIDPDILLLESPTDHLDVVNIEWIQGYIKECTKTVIFTSQSKETLNACCTHIAQIRRLKLNIFYGNLDELIKQDSHVEEYFKMDKKEKGLTFHFPDPGILDGVKSRSKAIIKMDNCTFTYPGNTKPTIENVSFKVSMVSRVGVCGKNGEGKSTAIKLLTGENIPQMGTVYKHPSVRLGYLAQHSFDTINDHPNKTANEYIRWRFEIPGEDREAIKKKSTTLNEEEEEQMLKSYTFQFKGAEGTVTKMSGVVQSLTGLRKKEKDGTLVYQVKWAGKGDDANTYVPLAELEKANKICFGKLVKAVDEKIAAMAGLYIKPLTQSNVEDHLAQIGLEPELSTHTKLSQLSDGEKVKAVLGACMWMSPHVVVFDEPTNSLSWDSLVALVSALKEFQGGVVVISHNQAFVDEVCNEIWLMAKDPSTGIAHMSVTGGDTTDMKEIFDEKQKEDTYIDGAGNVCEIKKKLTEKEAKKRVKDISKKLADAAKGKTSLTEDEQWELRDELALLGG